MHGVGGAPGTSLAGLLGEGLEPVAPLPALRGAPPRVVAAVSGPKRELAELAEGLPEGPAQPEAIAARLRARGTELEWGEPVEVSGTAALLALCRDRGRSSVEMLRAQPDLLGWMQAGSWFDGTFRVRALRRAALRWRLVRARAPAARTSARLAALADLAFWVGVAERAEPGEWERLTRSSYVALVYHRFAGESKPGQERIDIHPRRFGRQLAALRLAGFRPLPAEQMLAFQGGGGLPRRRVAITVDDGMRDCVAPLRRHAAWLPQLFVPTGELGGEAHWIGGEPVADWGEVEGLAEAGVGIGSHAMHHRRLTELLPAERQAELAGSLAELRERLPNPLSMLAYPNGAHDAAVCAAAREAGYAAAYTTEKGRNGAAADPHALRRVSVHAADGMLAILWKAATGEGLPGIWLRLRERLGRG